MRSIFLNPRHRGAGLQTCLVLALLGSLLALSANAQIPGANPQRHEQASLPTEISPEALKSLEAGGVPFILIDADERDSQRIATAGPVRRIYYTLGPSFRSAQNRVAQDRQHVQSPEAKRTASQRLIGTPLDWQQLGLKFNRNPVPSAPLSLTPRRLAESIKDGADLQIVDLRALSGGDEASPFPSVRRFMPHELDGELVRLTKKRWLVLVDGGDRAAQPVAERLQAQGFLLIAVLEGGYPAWVEATDR